MGAPDGPPVLTRRRRRVRRGRRGRLVHARLARRVRRPWRRSARRHAAGARSSSLGSSLSPACPALLLRSILGRITRFGCRPGTSAPAAPAGVGARDRHSIRPLAARCRAGVAGARRAGALRALGIVCGQVAWIAIDVAATATALAGRRAQSVRGTGRPRAGLERPVACCSWSSLLVLIAFAAGAALAAANRARWFRGA